MCNGLDQDGGEVLNFSTLSFAQKNKRFRDKGLSIIIAPVGKTLAFK